MDIVKAAEAGLLVKVLSALKEGVPVDTTDENGQTALMLSSWKGHAKVVEKLLAAGAQPDHQDNSGFTALMLASQKGHKEVVEALLKGGATVHMQNKDGWTALMSASKNNHLKVVEKLLAAGAQPDHQNNDGETALIFASLKGHAKVVEKLLAAGAQPDHQHNSGFTALMAASQEGHKEVVEALLKGGSTVDMQKKSGFTALMAASSKGHKEVVEALLKGGSTVDMPKENGFTALMAASQEGHKEVVEALLKGGSTVGMQKKDGKTAVSLATSHGHHELAELLHRASTENPKKGSNFSKLSLVEIEYSDLEIMEKVGSGGFATVSKGRWISKNKIVAIKMMMVLEEKEVRILSSLEHPSIIQYYGTATQNTVHYIVTEFAENGSIYDYIYKQKKQPPLSQRLHWAVQVAEGMVYLHQRDIIHRDLKSSNVVLTSTLKAKICDLGSARSMEHTTRHTTAVGTYAWMAPEILRREKVSKSCDVYSYGVLLFEIVTEQLPFADVYPVLVPSMTMEGKRPTIPDTCEPHLADLIKCCWQQDPKVRPSFKNILVTLSTELQS